MVDEPLMSLKKPYDCHQLSVNTEVVIFDVPIRFPNEIVTDTFCIGFRTPVSIILWT